MGLDGNYISFYTDEIISSVEFLKQGIFRLRQILLKIKKASRKPLVTSVLRSCKPSKIYQKARLPLLHKNHISIQYKRNFL